MNGKRLNLNAVSLTWLVATTFALPLQAAPSINDTMGALGLTGTVQALINQPESVASSSLSGNSFRSLATLADAQGHEFVQSVSRRQNKLHTLGHATGSSPVFFGEEDEKNADDRMNDVLDYFTAQLNLSDDEKGILPEVWTGTLKRKGAVDAASRIDSYDYDLNGFSGGVDVKLESWAFGFAGGYSRTSSGFEALQQTSTAVDAYHAAAYATYAAQNISFDNIASFSFLDNSSKRSLGAVNDKTRAEARSKGFLASYSFSAMGHYTWNRLAITPVAGFSFTTLHHAGMDEEGGGLLNLSAAGVTRHSLKPMVGVDIARAYQLEGGTTLTPEVYAMVRYEMLDAQESSATRFNALENLSTRSLTSTLGRRSTQVGASLGLQVSEGLSAKLAFDSDIQPSSHETRVMFKLNAAW